MVKFIKITLIEILEIIFIFVFVFLPIRLFIFEPFIVIGESMEPNFHNTDYLVICKICTKINPPQRGEVIVFKPPVDETKYYIKRVIALPEEEIEIKDNKIYIYSPKENKRFILEEHYLKNKNFYLEDMNKIKLKKDEYFVMGDNREQSFDSRKWGPLKKDKITGKVLFRISFLGNLIKIIKFNNLG
jgi:signal peptidase I